MLSNILVSLTACLLQISHATCKAIPSQQPQAVDARNQTLHTWWHAKSSVNTDSAVARDEVRRSRKYNVSVSLAGHDEFQESFVYESIPRNGNGRMYDPANPDEQYNLADGDGITIEADAGINMAWSQFQYGVDVDVKIVSTDGSKLGSIDDVVIRPSSTKYEVKSVDCDSITISVPFDPHGRRFSVEFQNDLFTYRTNGSAYVLEGGLIVSEEPKDALLIFASPFIPTHLIPSKTASDVQVLQPGRIINGTIKPQPTLYFQAGTYWMENNGILGQSHMKLDPNTHFVFLEPGAYIKGAFEYTTSNPDFYTIGHGVVSGENYAYMSNTAESYKAIKSDRTSLRIFSHGSVANNQTWHCLGPTLASPPFNTVDLFPKANLTHEEDNKVHSYISDYKQVGAFYLQTDGSQIYAGETKDVFWHANDDAIKLYHSDARVSNVTVWKVYNDPVIQMGWYPRDVNNVTITALHIIHSRWYQSLTGVPSAIIGASPYYSTPKLVDANRTIAAEIRDVSCEGRCPALLRVAPMNNYNLTIQNVRFDELIHDDDVKLGVSLVGTRISEAEDAYIEGQEALYVGIRVSDWSVGGVRVDEMNWRSDQLGQLNFNETFWGEWSIS